MSGSEGARSTPALGRFWQRDESLSLLLALLVVVTFVLPPLVDRQGHSRPVAFALFSAMLALGVTTVLRQNRVVVLLVAVLGLAAVLMRWVAWLRPEVSYGAWSAATTTFALAVLALVVLTMVLREGTITRYRIEGAIAAYLLLGLAWAEAYHWTSLLDPAAFSSGGGDVVRQQWVYYSFVTLTTMGYGDITPISETARSLAVAEALTGQLYLAILISRLVALELQARQDR